VEHRGIAFSVVERFPGGGNGPWEKAGRSRSAFAPPGAMRSVRPKLYRCGGRLGRIDEIESTSPRTAVDRGRFFVAPVHRAGRYAIAGDRILRRPI